MILRSAKIIAWNAWHRPINHVSGDLRFPPLAFVCIATIRV